jgi:plastocyanin
MLPAMRWSLTVLLLAAASAQAADLKVEQKGRAFRPNEISIVRGQAVIFTNADSFIHQIYVDGLFDSEEQAPGQNLNEIFRDAGTFQVRCHIHPTMRMIVHVK